MPYAQSHYPFENRAHFEAHFPADFIAEGLDQTRGWFYTLMVLSTALFDRPAFRNVVVNGLILAADGRKMSKRLKNYPDPAQLIDTYGADALRLYMIHSPVVRAEDLCFTEDGVKEALRHVLIPWWNAFSFFVTYARVDGWTPAAGDAPPPAGRPLLDRWILSALDGLISEVSAAMEGYDLQRAVRPFVGFTEHLTNWYIRRSRRRVWKSDNDADKLCAYATLYHVLLELSKVAAPFVPFISEAVYRHLRLPAMPESVHLCDFPEPDGARDAALEERMAAAIAVVGCGRRLRAEHNLKVRQPLAMVHVICRNTGRLEQLRPLESLLAEELNVKQVHFSSHESDLVTLRIKPNFRALGPRLGPAVKTLAPLLAGLSQEAIEKLLGGEALTLTVDGKDLALEAGDVQVERAPREGLVVATEGEWVVGLDTALDEALVSEGLARELVNRIQSMRKGLGLEVSQRIRLFMDGDEPLLAAAHAHSEYIRSEVLAAAFTVGDRTTEEAERLEIEGHACRIRISLPGD